MKEAEVLENLQQDRRLHPRLYRCFVMRYGVLDDISAPAVDRQGSLLDISGGGLRFSCTDEIESSSQLLIEIDIPGWRVVDGDWMHTGNDSDIGRLRVVGQVVWIRDDDAGRHCEVGIRFTGQIR